MQVKRNLCSAVQSCVCVCVAGLCAVCSVRVSVYTIQLQCIRQQKAHLAQPFHIEIAKPEFCAKFLMANHLNFKITEN